MAETNQQREAVARIVSYCERLIQLGELRPDHELALRQHVNSTCAAFSMAPVQERSEILNNIASLKKEGT